MYKIYKQNLLQLLLYCLINDLSKAFIIVSQLSTKSSQIIFDGLGAGITVASQGIRAILYCFVRPVSRRYLEIQSNNAI